jgi:hypothetical protein
MLLYRWWRVKISYPNNSDKEWVFPNLASGSATSILTAFLKECAVAVGELHVDVTATDLRASSLCEIVYAEGGGLEIAIEQRRLNPRFLRSRNGRQGVEMPCIKNCCGV